MLNFTELDEMRETHDGEQVVDGMNLCKALAKATGIDPMRAFQLVGRTANTMGAEVLAIGPKADRAAYRLADADEIATYVLVTA